MKEILGRDMVSDFSGSDDDHISAFDFCKKLGGYRMEYENEEIPEEDVEEETLVLKKKDASLFLPRDKLEKTPWKMTIIGYKKLPNTFKQGQEDDGLILETCDGFKTRYKVKIPAGILNYLIDALGESPKNWKGSMVKVWTEQDTFTGKDGKSIKGYQLHLEIVE